MESEDAATVSGEIMWVGAYWTCRKKLKHYYSFRVNGFTISVHSFCYILNENEGEIERVFAYIVDLYEGKKSQKRMQIKWLHTPKEMKSPIPPPKPLENELIMSPDKQVLRLESFDGGVDVLTPTDYNKMSKEDLATYGGHVYVCRRKLGRGGVQLYDISTLEGYFSQKIFSSGYLSDNDRAKTDVHEDEQAGSADVHEEGRAGSFHAIRRARRTSRRRYTGRYGLFNDEGDWTPQQECYQLSYNAVNAVTSSESKFLNVLHDPDSDGDDWRRVGNKVEVLSEDSGMRGCWFSCTVLETNTSVKVRYDDILEEGTGIPLEEWVSGNKIANADKLGIRIPGRQVMRPLPPEVEMLSANVQGSAVDAWGGEGWWEGIWMSKNADGQVQVGFPAENYAAWFDESKVRVSRDWVDGQWLAVQPDANIIDKISGLHTERLVSSQVQELCPENDRILCPGLLSGIEAASQSPNLGAEGREPDQGVKQSVVASYQANKVLALYYERPTNPAFENSFGKVKGFSANLKSAARQSSTQAPIFEEFKEGVKLSNHYSKWSVKVSESSSTRHHEDLSSECVPANSSKNILEDNDCSQLAELQQLDVDRDKENNTDVVGMTCGGLFSKMSRKRYLDSDSSFFARSTKSGLFGSRDPSADLLLNHQDDLSAGVFTLNKLTEIGNVEVERPQYRFEQVTSSPLFNSVSVQNLVLSR